MNHYASSSEDSVQSSAVGFAHLVIVEYPACTQIPNLDAESVNASASGDLSVDRCQHEAITSRTVYCSLSLVLRSGAGDNQPLVTGTMKVKVTNFEVEFSFPGGESSSFLILRNKAEIGPADKQWIGSICSEWRIEP